MNLNKTRKIIAHRSKIDETDKQVCSEFYYILAQTGFSSWQWLAVEKAMINRMLDTIFESPQEAIDWMVKYDQDVVFEPYEHMEVY